MSSDIDNKVVSISFNNKQFLKDVEDTISVIEDLNKATSGKNIDTSGIDDLSKAFRNATNSLTNDAGSVTKSLEAIQAASNVNFQTGGIDNLRKALENTGMTAVDVEDTITALQQLSKTGVSYASDLGFGTTATTIQNESANTRDSIIQDLDDVQDHFSALELIAMGVCLSIGNKVVELGQNAFSSLTAGIRDGWAEYNALTNSTQTILVNTQRWGSTMEDVSSALEDLNRYADMTTYSFSDMTRNIGYFTTAGINLEDSVTAIQGLSNVGAMFGADASSVARAGYQISQAMSAGVIKLMDWRSMINAGMGGQLLQDELIKTAAVMSGTSVDAMNDYIESLGGFNASLQEGWLTSDIFLEAMRKFAGQSREYYESLTDANGNRLYTDEEIDYYVKLGEEATESATRVRTLQQMMDAFKESIGSGWQRTFTAIIGNLEEAYEFWTPINDVLTGLVDRFFDLQTSSLDLWRSWGGREQLLQGIQNVLQSISGLLSAIGGGFADAFGGANRIGPRLAGITEAFTDLSERLILSEEEVSNLRDFFTGLFEPIALVVDIIFELIKAFFDAGDGMAGVETTADSLYDSVGSFGSALARVLGFIGRVLKAGAEWIRGNNRLRKVIQTFASIIVKVFSLVTKVISAPFILLYRIWERYNIGEKLDEFAMKAATFFLPIIDAIEEVKTVFKDWFDLFDRRVLGLLDHLDPIETFIELFNAVKQLFRDLFDPTVSLSDAFGNFVNGLQGGNIDAIFEAICSAVSNLWSQLKDTTIGQWFEDTQSRIQNAWAAFQQTDFGSWVSGVVDSIKDFLDVDTSDWDSFWLTTQLVITEIADDLEAGWNKIKTFFTELTNIVKSWFGLSDDASAEVEDSMDTMSGAIGGNMLSGQIAQLPGIAEMVNESLKVVTDGAVYAEENIPDPENSNFLDYLASIPEKLHNILETLTGSQVVENIKELFFMIVGGISSFLGEDIGTQKEDVISFFVNRLGDFESFLSILSGFENFNFRDHTIFELLGACIGAFINGFAGVDPVALRNVERVVNLVLRIFNTMILARLVQATLNISATVRSAAKGWEQMQKAANNLAKASKWMAIANVMSVLVLGILGIMGAVALFAYMWANDDYKVAMAIGLSAVAVAFGLLILFVDTLMKNVEKIDADGLKAVKKVVHQLSFLMLSLMVSVAGFFAIVYLVYKVLSDENTNARALMTSIWAVASVFVIVIAIMAAIVAGIIALEKYGQISEEQVKTTGKLLAGISALMLGVSVMVIGILAAITALTYILDNVFEHENGAAFASAMIVMMAILAMAIGAIAALVYVANKLTNDFEDTEVKNFGKIILGLASLMVVVAGIIVVLITAMTAFMVAADQLTTVGSVETAMLAAAIAIGAILAIFFYFIYKITDRADAMARNNTLDNVKSTFGGIVAIMATLMAGIIAMIAISALISNYTNDALGVAVIMGTLVASMLAVEGGLEILIIILQHMDVHSISPDKLQTMGSLIECLLFTILSIAAALSMVALALGYSGLDSRSLWDMWATISLMFLTVSVIITAFGLLIKHQIIDVNTMKGAATGLLLATTSLLVIAAALAMVNDSIKNVNVLWDACGAILAILAVMSIALGALTAITKNDFLAVISAGAAIAVAAFGITFIASALGQLASLNVSNLQKAANKVALCIGVAGAIMIILAAIGSTGAGAIGVVAAAAAMLFLGFAFMAFGEGILVAGEGCEKASNGLNGIVDALERFKVAFDNLADLDTSGFNDRVNDILETVVHVAEGMLLLAPVLGDSIKTLLKSVAYGLAVGFAEGLKDGLLEASSYIYDYGPTIAAAFAYLGALVLQVLHAWTIAFGQIIIDDFGEGGIVRRVISSLSGFVAWVSALGSEWAITILDAVLTTVIRILTNETRIQRIASAIHILFLKVKDWVLTKLGVPSFKDIGRMIITEILNGLVEKAQTVLTSGGGGVMTALLQELGIADVEGAFESMSQALESNSAGLAAAGHMARQREINQLTNDLLNLNEATTHYDPSSYYAHIAGETDYATDSTNSFNDAISTGIDLLSEYGGGLSGISDLLSNIDLGAIGEQFSGIFNTDNLGSASGLADMLGGLGDIDLSNLDFGNINFLGGILGDNGITDMFSTTWDLGQLMGQMDEQNRIENTPDYYYGSDLPWGDGMQASKTYEDTYVRNGSAATAYGYYDENGNLILYDEPITVRENVYGVITPIETNPVITPVIDTDQYDLQVADMAATWNKANIGEFAIDAGHSVLTSQRTEAGKNAATDGSVSVSYTQTIMSPKEVAPIEVYRDTKNLLRGSFNY